MRFDCKYEQRYKKYIKKTDAKQPQHKHTPKEMMQTHNPIQNDNDGIQHDSRGTKNDTSEMQNDHKWTQNDAKRPVFNAQ